MAPGIEPESSRLAVSAISHSALIIANSPQRQLNSTLIPEGTIAGDRCVLLCDEQLTGGCYSHCAKTRPCDYGVKLSCRCALRIAGATLLWCLALRLDSRSAAHHKHSVYHPPHCARLFCALALLAAVINTLAPVKSRAAVRIAIGLLRRRRTRQVVADSA